MVFSVFCAGCNVAIRITMSTSYKLVCISKLRLAISDLNVALSCDQSFSMELNSQLYVGILNVMKLSLRYFVAALDV